MPQLSYSHTGDQERLQFNVTEFWYLILCQPLAALEAVTEATCTVANDISRGPWPPGDKMARLLCKDIDGHQVAVTPRADTGRHKPL